MKTNRQRWYKIRFNSPFTNISERIKSLPFSQKNPIGFELIETSNKRIGARYIERQYISDEIQHPFGEIEEVITVKYTIFYFEMIYIANGRALLKILNHPVSLRGFVKRLTDICNNNLSISKITFKLNNIYKTIISDSSVDRYSVRRLSVSSIPFSEETTARLNLNSTGNAYEELKKKYKDAQYNLEKIFIDARVNGLAESISISSSGSVVCSHGFENIIEEYVLNLI